MNAAATQISTAVYQVMNAPKLTERMWSPYQENIFDWIVDGSGNAIIRAVAGSGKSNTLVECVKLIKIGLSHIFLAFNKAIAEELVKRGVNARTFHSLCCSIVMRHVKANKVTQNKLRILVEENLGDKEVSLYGSFICKLVSMGKNAGIDALIRDTPEAWMDLVDHHDLELEHENATMERAIKLASCLLRASNESNMVDFDDMLYVAVREGLALPKFDWVFGDEMQDTNAIQRAILRKIMKDDTRFVGVGDEAQAIYGFRGADSDSMKLLADEFNCKTLPLTVSYRCPVSVVKYAQTWVKEIEHAPNAPEGSVSHLGQNWNTKDFAIGDLVVCRTTKPLICAAYTMLKNHQPVTIMGKEIGKGLISLIERMNARGIESLTAKLNDYTTREVEKCKAKKQEAKGEAIQDKTDAILTVIDGMKETNRTIPALIDIIETLFASKTDCTTLATIHKAKGLEAKKVFWLTPAKCRQPTQDWQIQEENHLCYVAVTRAMQELVCISEKTDKVAHGA